MSAFYSNTFRFRFPQFDFNGHEITSGLLFKVIEVSFISCSSDETFTL